MLKPGNEPVDLSVDILSSIIFPISDFSWEEFRHMSHRRIGIDTADSLLRPRGIYAYKMQSSNTTPAGTIRRKTYCNLRIWTRIHRCICTAIGTPAGIEGQDLTLPVLLTDIHCSSYIGQSPSSHKKLVYIHIMGRLIYIFLFSEFQHFSCQKLFQKHISKRNIYH